MPWLYGNERWGDDFKRKSPLRQQTLQAKSCSAGLIAGPHHSVFSQGLKCLVQFAEILRVEDFFQKPGAAETSGLKNRPFVDIQADICGSARLQLVEPR